MSVDYALYLLLLVTVAGVVLGLFEWRESRHTEVAGPSSGHQLYRVVIRNEDTREELALYMTAPGPITAQVEALRAAFYARGWRRSAAAVADVVPPGYAPVTVRS